MDDVQFIIECPQASDGHRKRPRLVTSCDNCRLKKIKCLQSSSSSGKCEACRLAKIPCRFRDRERYFAERSRAISSPGLSSKSSQSFSERSSSSRGSPVNDDRSSTQGSELSLDTSSDILAVHHPPSSVSPASSYSSPTPSGIVTTLDDTAASYRLYTPDPRRVVDPYSYNGCSSPAAYSTPSPRDEYPTYGVSSRHSHQYPSPSSGSFSPDQRRNLSSIAPISLFDPQRTQYPHTSFMPHFIHIFFEKFGGPCPFLIFDEIMARFFDQSLPPFLANCIAALAARFTDLPELVSRGVQTVAETYSNQAKNLLSPVVHMPSIDTLHSLILMAWSEYKAGRTAGCRAYSQMAMRMAIDLGISDDSPVQMSSGGQERNKFATTWTSIVQLHYFSSSCKGSWSWAGSTQLTPHVNSDFSLVGA